MMDYMRERISEPNTWMALFIGLAHLVMVFTPDNIDQMIQTVLDNCEPVVMMFISLAMVHFSGKKQPA